MPITLSGSEIRLAWQAGDDKGDTWLNPWRYTDILDAADAAGGWAGLTYDGVNIKLDGLSIRTMNVSTYLIISECIVDFHGDIADSVNGSVGNVQIGENEGEGTIISIMNTSGNRRNIYFHRLYNAVLIGQLARWNSIRCFEIAEKSKIYGGRNETFYSPATGFQLNDLQISRSRYGLYPYRSDCEYNDIFVYQCYVGVQLFNVTGITFRNIKIRETTIADIRSYALVNNSVENTLINCDFETISFAWLGTTTEHTYNKLNIGEEFSIIVMSPDGNKLENALVSLKDKNGTEIFSELTDSDGNYNQDVIRRIALSEKSPPLFAEVNSDTNYNPFVITVSYAGYKTYEAPIEINAKTDLQIQLEYPELLISAVTITDCTAIGASDGQLEITAEGGDGSYTYSINGVDYQASNTFSGLSAGDYTVYVKDGEGTVANFEVTISQPIPEAYADDVLTCDLAEEVLTCDFIE